MKSYITGNHKGLLLIPIIIFTALLVTSCSKKTDNYGSVGNGGGSGPGAGEVWMQNTAFTPATITIAVNGTVTWTNKDSFSHDVIADDNSFSSGSISGGGTFSHKFTAAGTYTYKCSFHLGMSGKVVVQ